MRGKPIRLRTSANLGTRERHQHEADGKQNRNSLWHRSPAPVPIRGPGTRLTPARWRLFSPRLPPRGVLLPRVEYLPTLTKVEEESDEPANLAVG
jgi:hypothetical protein